MQRQASSPSTPQSEWLSGMLPMRLATAVVQAIALCALIQGSGTAGSWQGAYPRLFAPLLLAFVYTPLVVMVGLGQMRGRTLAIWASIVAVVIAALGFHEIARGSVVEYAHQRQIWPRFSLFLAISAALFTAHVLVLDGTAERRLFPSYERHFNTAWKLGLQLALSALFVGVLWLLLLLGAELFRLLGLNGFREIMGRAWFAYPVTTLALAIALHLTDVQPALIRGLRAIVLGLLSWLLPVLAAIVAAFLCSLAFTSLEPLWQTNFATSMLLATMAALVFLINCTYQDGIGDHAASRVKRLAATGGAILLLPLCALAIRALSLRVLQYGWTQERIIGAVAVSIAACYAIGYAIAAVRSPSWFKRIEAANVAAAYLAIAAMLAIFSPIADPARLMVGSQVERLRTGAVTADKFDFTALKYDGGRWGTAALEELARRQHGPDAKAIRDKAEHVLASKSRYASAQEKPVTRDNLADRIKLLTPGRSLPAEFYEPAFWTRQSLALQCLKDKNAACTAAYIALSPGEPDAILFADTYSGIVFQQDTRGSWQLAGKLGGPVFCQDADLRQAMQDGKIALAPHYGQDVIVNGVRFTVLPDKNGCPDTPPGK